MTVIGNRTVGNRIGVSVLSNYLEAHGPTTGLVVVGNLVADNNAVETPEQAAGAFGVGIGLAGAADATIRDNRITGNRNVGLWVTSSEDFAPLGTHVVGNAWSANGLDVAFAPASGVPGQGNCFEIADAVTAEPEGLIDAGCDAEPPTGAYTQPPAPAGISFADVAPLPERPGLDAVDAQLRTLPDRVEPPELPALPADDLLADAS